ncbi:hypothetical protein BDZ97DRAFT_1852754 [Flammula alnicola]|nr:hypothetical protein BDZ97DRAFT_1852754 [Flammula alnicola]
MDPKYPTTDFDVFAMREAVKAVHRFVSAPAWSDYVIGPHGSFATATDGSSIDAYERGLTTTIFHAVGTPSMAPENSNTGVVNPDLTVKGDGLRIVDVSVFVSSPRDLRYECCWLLAARASDIIEGRHSMRCLRTRTLPGSSSQRW